MLEVRQRGVAGGRQATLFFLNVVLNIVAVVLCGGTSLITFAVVSLVASIWSMGIASNFREDPESIPSYAIGLHFISTVGGVGLTIAGIIV